MRKAQVKKPDSKVVPAAQALVVGKVVTAALAPLKPNNWNPNVMTPFEKQSLKHGFRRDGWLASHALTVWRTDPKGKVMNIIIDGEHRHAAALELGMVEGPVVFMDGISEAEAIALTIKLDQKRGHFDEQKLGVALRRIEPTMELETRSLDFGILEQELSSYFEPELEAPTEGVIGELPSGQTSAARMIQLFFQPADYEEFVRLQKDLAIRFGTKTSTDTVFEALRRAHAVTSKK
ncbi:MAG: ParB N-terminal domain-containing protein [Polyangiaceae bacterium]